MMIYGDKDKITIANKCPWCGRNYKFDVPTPEYMKWREGALIQEAFVSLNPTEREFMLTGYCKECQDKIFGGEDD